MSASVHPRVDLLAAYAWRLVVIAVAVIGVVWFLGEVRVVALPLFAATLMARLLQPVHRVLIQRNVPAALSAAACTALLALLVFAVLLGIGVSVASQLDDVRASMREGLDDIETWLTDEDGLGLDEQQVRNARDGLGEAVSNAGTGARGSIRSGATIAAEVVAGTVLGLIVTFFLLKDGPRIVGGATRALPPRRRMAAGRYAARTWNALGGYLRGAAILGAIEAVLIGGAMLLAGADLVLPVMALTFVAGFVPVVGAVVAGVIAVLVTLATGGVVPALVVLAVAVVVQQLDNDLLAPWIYGRSLRVPALAILIGVATGTALFGIVGAFVSVPLIAIALGVLDEARSMRDSPSDSEQFHPSG